MPNYTAIPIKAALEALCQIGERLEAPHLVIGGLAVNHYHKARDTKDIDLICSHATSKQVLEVFTSDLWDIMDKNDDPERPSYVFKNKSDDNICIHFGPKILERGAYDYLDWDVLSVGGDRLTYQNREINNIFIPSSSNLAYMKLISFLFRSDVQKKSQDITDFVNITNHDTFSVSRFVNVARKLNAITLLNERRDAIAEACERFYDRSVMHEFFKMFSRSKDVGGEFRRPAERWGERGESKFISRMLDAVLFFRDATAFAGEEIRSYLDGAKVLPSRLLYKTDEGCQSWINLCKSPRYSFYLRSYNNLAVIAKDIVEIIAKTAGRTDFDFISLGVGDGKKDGVLLTEFLGNTDDGEYIYYYPMDINPTMIELAAKHLSEARGIIDNLDSLRVKPFVGDFLGINKMEMFYNYRLSPNVFSILGNTIGNNDESAIIETLEGAMGDGDFAIIEINTDIGFVKDSELDRTQENRDLDIGPIIAARIKMKDIRYKKIDGAKVKNMYSTIPNTVSTLCECDVSYQATKKREIDSKVKVSVVNRYSFKDFVSSVSGALSSRVIYSDDSDGIGVIVLYKPRDA